jgi:hypothetical protein
MGDQFFRSAFIASAVIARMRDGDYPSPPVAGVLDSLPFIEAIRTALHSQDIEWLLTVVERPEEELAGFAVAAMHKHMTEHVVTAFQRRWDSAFELPYLRNRILWRLLDRRDLSDEWHEKLVAFVFENWLSFTRFNRGFFGTGQRALMELRKRLDNPNVPASKKWVYYCCAPAVADDPMVQIVISRGLMTGDNRAKHVCQRLLDNGWPRHGVTGDDARPRTAHTSALRYLAGAVAIEAKKSAAAIDIEALRGLSAAISRFPEIATCEEARTLRNLLS